MVVPTTSINTMPHPEVHILLPEGEGGLHKKSIAKCDQLTTLNKRFLVQGPLVPPIHLSYCWKIIRAARRALGDNT